MADGRLVGAAVLAGGIAVLALGTTYALRRESAPESPSAAPAAGTVIPEVTYVHLPLAAYQAAVAGRADAPLPFTVVPSEIEARIRTGDPPLRPDFASLFYVREYEGQPSSTRAFVQAFREKKVANESHFVVGLLVAPPAVGSPIHLRLEVERTALRGFTEMLDATDALEYWDSTAPRPAVESSERAQIEWTAEPGEDPRFVPLLLLHGFSIPDVPANQDVIEMGGQQYWWQLATHAYLSPRRLHARSGDGPEREIDISGTLSSPLFIAGAR